MQERSRDMFHMANFSKSGEVTKGVCRPLFLKLDSEVAV